MDDIFDIKNIDDLPVDLVSELRLANKVDSRILKLFLLANRPLNLSQLLVGYYRKYNEEKPRNYMMALCYRLAKKGLLEPTSKKGEYTISERGKILGESEVEDD